jgi:hypothetical protein
MSRVLFIVRAAWPIVLVATLVGLVSGTSSIRHLGAIHAAMSRGTFRTVGLIGLTGLCLLRRVSRTGFQALLMRLRAGLQRPPADRH